MKIRIIAVVVAVGVLLSVCGAQADIFMKQKNHSDAMTIMGHTEPAKDEVSTTWLSKDKVRHDTDKMSMIMLLDEGVLYVLQHDKKSYMAMPLKFDVKAQQPQVDMGLTFTVTPGNESKKINNWNCKKYITRMSMGQMGMSVTTEVWATQDLKIDPAIYSKFVSAAMAANPMMSSMMDKMVQEMKKIQGVQVYSATTTQMMGQSMKSTVELLEFKEGTAPAGIFKLPAGYKKESFKGMQ